MRRVAMSVAKDGFAFSTPRLAFRKPLVEDLPYYTAYCASMRSQYAGGPFDSVRAGEKFEAMCCQWDQFGLGRYIFVEGDTGRPLGHVGAIVSEPTSCPEMSWTIWAAGDEGKGYAFEAARRYFAHLRFELDFRVMFAQVSPRNAGSLRLAQRLGGVRTYDRAPPQGYPDFISFDFCLDAFNLETCDSGYSRLRKT